MDIIPEQITTTTDYIRNPNKIMDKLKEQGKLVIFKSNKPQAVLLTIEEYENLLVLVDKK